MRAEGHKAIVHTAAASNLGQMLVRICRSDGIPLVNIIRSAEQEDLLRQLGASHVVNSSHPEFGIKFKQYANRAQGAQRTFYVLLE